jgi:hypothetical protein
MSNIFDAVSVVMPYLESISLMEGSKSSDFGVLYTVCTSAAKDSTCKDSPMLVIAHGLPPKRFLEALLTIQAFETRGQLTRHLNTYDMRPLP